MSLHQNKIRVVAASSVRDKPRLTPVAPTGGLTVLQWNLVGRTDDGLSLTFIVDLARQRVIKVVGVHVVEDDDSVTVAILGSCSTSNVDRAAHTLFGEYMINIASPLADRAVINPAISL